MRKLYETYENCAGVVGMQAVDGKGVLLPIGHTTQNAQITITLDGDGNLTGAKAVDKADAVTVIPCTLDSASRSSGITPHPLFDKLPYLAGDCTLFCDDKGDKHAAYMKELALWCTSPYTHPKVQAIWRYLQQGTLIADLVDKNVLFVGEDGKLLVKWNGDKDETPLIFKVSVANQQDAFVRFCVDIPGDNPLEVWMDQNVRNNYIAYTLSQQQNAELCYVTGQKIPAAKKHSAKIRNTADKAKLISGNDNAGFTYRGRFLESDHVVCIGYDTSQKAHNALRWLIDNRGFHSDDQVIVAWGVGGQRVPLPTEDSEDIFGEALFDNDPGTLTENDQLLEVDSNTQRRFSKRLNAALLGRRYDLDTRTEVVVMALDSATVGRLAIIYYRVLSSGDYLERVANWHDTCKWLHSYKKDGDKKYYTFEGAPASRDIAAAAYGKDVGAKLRKATIERLLPCIFDGAKIPRDLVDAAVRRASNPAALEYWEWNKTLGISCALYKKQHEEEALSLALEENRTDRNYLYGRLLAVADKMESMTFERGENRQTNAMRYMNAFSQHPMRTWQIIVERLAPYEAKLGSRGHSYKNLISQIMSQFQEGEFEDNNRLDGLYLLGYHCQRQVFIEAAKVAREKRDAAKLEAMQKNDNNGGNEQ